MEAFLWNPAKTYTTNCAVRTTQHTATGFGFYMRPSSSNSYRTDRCKIWRISEDGDV